MRANEMKAEVIYLKYLKAKAEYEANDNYENEEKYNELKAMLEPCDGMLATYCIGSDEYAYQVMCVVNDKTIVCAPYDLQTKKHIIGVV